MATTARHGMPPARHASAASLTALAGANFFIADMLTGFGPFVTVYLSSHGWNAADIGIALSTGTFASILAQLPAGVLVDAVHHRRIIASVAILGIAAGALMLAAFPLRWPVLSAQAMLGVGGTLLTPAIAAITLALADQEHLGEVLGNNVRFKALGSMLTALLMGYIGSRVSSGAVFLVASVFGGFALGALWMIRRDDLDEAGSRTSHPGALPPIERRHHPRPAEPLWRNRPLVIFAVCAFSFQLCNAALFPFAIDAIERAGARDTGLDVSAALVVSQAVAALISPLVGRQAAVRGRRVVLLAGFAMLPLRALLYAARLDPVTVVAFHALDGVSAAVFGVLMPLVIADVTYRAGRFNLAMGIVGLVMTVGATISTLGAGFIAQNFGLAATFLALAVPGLAGCLLVLLALPETRHMVRRPRKPPEASRETAAHVA